MLRILAGGMLLYTHLVWGTVLHEFLGSQGWNSVELVGLTRTEGFSPSFWWYVPDEWLLTVHWVCIAVLALLMVGLGGRLTAFLAWVITVSYAHRTAPANFGLDQINCLLSLYLVIGPSTQCLSVDSWLKRKLGWHRPDSDRSSSSANIALRLIQCHLCIIYLWAGLGKLQGEAWWDGNAIWLAIANYEYQSMDLTWLASYPRLLELLTHLTIAWEIGFIFLVWPRATRWLMLSVGIGMHVGIGMFLGMWTFGSIMCFAYLAFASGGWMRERLSMVVSDGTNQISQQMFPIARPTKQTGRSVGRTVVLITDCQRSIDHFLGLNSESPSDWVVVPNIHEAEKLVSLLPKAKFLSLEIKLVNENPRLEYLSLRIVQVRRAQKASASSMDKISSRRVVPK